MPVTGGLTGSEVSVAARHTAAKVTGRQRHTAVLAAPLTLFSVTHRWF